MFGSLPEYIYSVSTNRSSAGSSVSSGVYINMFSASNFTFNASTAPLAAPALAPPPPVATVEPIRPAPQMTYKLISPAGGGYYTGESTCVGQGNCPGQNASSLAACKALCLGLAAHAGDRFESCMGVSWTAPPAPPSPPAPAPPTPWPPRKSDPCVMYKALTKTPSGKPGEVISGARGYVKCKNGTHAPGCATLGGAAPCTGAHYTMVALPSVDVHTGAFFKGNFLGW